MLDQKSAEEIGLADPPYDQSSQSRHRQQNPRIDAEHETEHRQPRDAVEGRENYLRDDGRGVGLAPISHDQEGFDREPDESEYHQRQRHGPADMSPDSELRGLRNHHIDDESHRQHDKSGRLEKSRLPSE